MVAPDSHLDQRPHITAVEICGAGRARVKGPKCDTMAKAAREADPA